MESFISVFCGAKSRKHGWTVEIFCRSWILDAACPRILIQLKFPIFSVLKHHANILHYHHFYCGLSHVSLKLFLHFNKLFVLIQDNDLGNPWNNLLIYHISLFLFDLLLPFLFDIKTGKIGINLVELKFIPIWQHKLALNNWLITQWKYNCLLHPDFLTVHVVRANLLSSIYTEMWSYIIILTLKSTIYLLKYFI